MAVVEVNLVGEMGALQDQFVPLLIHGLLHLRPHLTESYSEEGWFS